MKYKTKVVSIVLFLSSSFILPSWKKTKDRMERDKRDRKNGNNHQRCAGKI